MNIGPGRIINNFIEPNKRQYVIPVYQRNYEWAEDDCKKLFEDIVNAYKRDKEHFCGSIVFAPLNIGLNIQSYVIIDGQQRLTTIYLLLKALLDTATKDKDKEAILDTIVNKDKFDEFNVTDATKLKLKPVRSDNNQLMLIMEDRFDEVDCSSGIWRNYNLFCTLIKEAMEKDEDLTIKAIFNGIDKLSCARIQLDKDDNAQEIFERINSTGVPLSLADKIRNYVLMTDEEQDKLFEDYWLNIEKLVKKDYRNDFFYSYLNLKLDEFAKEKIAYEQFKDLFIERGYTNKNMLAELLHYAELYNSFMYGSSNYGNKVNELLANLQSLKQTTVYLFLYRIFDDYLSEGKLDEDELVKILELLVSYSVRRTICEINSNSLRGLYKTLYERVFQDEKNKDNYYDAIVSLLQQLTSRDVIPSDTEFKEALENNNLYKKNALCRFLLTTIENQGKEKLVTDNLTIEHIMPQNKDLSIEWREMLGDNWEDVRNKYLHTLGNLTLTGYNSELGDRPFAEKQDMLDDLKTKVVVLYQDVKGLEEWNECTIKKRAERLSSMVVDLFAYENPQKIITFNDPKYKEYTCDDPEAATYKTPNYFILNGERVLVASFAELLRKLIDKLYEIDKTIIEQMARNDEEILEWSSVVLFSYDYKKTWGDNYKVADSEIYESTGFSASNIIRIVSALLDRYDIDYEDFLYSAREGENRDAINRLEIAKDWCEKQSALGGLSFDKKNCTRYYVRFTTPKMNSILPDNDEVPSPWKTSNYYFYEIRDFHGELFIQLSVYCKTSNNELRNAIQKFENNINAIEVAGNYRIFFKSTGIQRKDEDDAESVSEQLDSLFNEVKAFEMKLPQFYPSSL